MAVADGLDPDRDPSQGPGRRRGLSPGRLWIALCVAAVSVGVAARALHFVDGLPGPLDALLGRVLALEFLSFLGAFFGTGLLAFLLVACLLLLLVRRRWCVERFGVRWRLRPWLAGILWAALVPTSFLLDLNPDLGIFYASTLPLAAGPFAFPAFRGLSGTCAAFALWAIATAVWVAWLPTPVAIPLGIAWAVAGILLSMGGARVATARDALGLLLALGGFLQLSALLPGANLQELAHGGTVLGDGRVYSFCDLPGRGTVFGAVTSCEGSDVEACRGDHVVAYERDALDQGPRVVSLFDDEFYGRMLHLLCLEDQVRVGMSFTMVDGTLHAENVMGFDPDHPEERIRRLLDAKTGHRMLHDPEAGTVYYVSEYSDRVDFERLGGGPDARGWFRVPSAPDTPHRLPLGSLQTEIGALSMRRNGLFFAQWIGGRRLFEVDRETHATRRTFAFENGGTHSLAIDDELERAIVSGLWGVEAIDLRSGEVIARWRTHLGPRLPVIDAARDRIYVTTTFGPSVWVFERRSFRPIGRLPIGVGARNAHLSRDGEVFFASNAERHFYWDADTLARRFPR